MEYHTIIVVKENIVILQRIRGSMTMRYINSHYITLPETLLCPGTQIDNIFKLK